ncbi:MAG: hypothetical protein LBR45_00450, partial [Bacteroidales bacterium]|nr:hypothetical protein [Bacteroidales bacterium]
NGVANSAVIALQFTDKSTPDILKVYAANGCGGTEVTLFVEPASSHYLSFIDSVCSGLEYKKNGFDIPRRDSAGFEIFTQRYQTQNGCDSIRNLYLNIYPTPDVTVKSSTDVICSDDSVQLQVTYANYEAPEELYEVKVGDILCEGDTVVAVEDFAASGKSAMGIVFWVSPDKTHGWAVGLAVKNTGTVWSAATRYVFVPNVTNFSANTAANISYFDTAGYKNTKAIRAFGNASEFPAAWAVDFDNGWFLPAITQVRVLFGNMELIRPSFIVAGASIGTTTNLWSSSQSGSTHAMAVGNTGYISSDNRYFTFAVRQIRYFSTGKK